MEFHRLAREELRQALGWYRAKSRQAAERFLLHTERTLQRVLADPAAFPRLGQHDHYLRISRFPFVLIYRLRPTGDVLIVAVAHTSRRSGYWRNRM